MYRQFGGSALLLLLMTSAISHVPRPGAAGRGGNAAGTGASAQSSKPAEQSALEADAHKCSIFQILRRYEGLAEQGGQQPTPDSNPNQTNSAVPDTLVCAQSHLAGTALLGIDKVRSQVLIATIPDPLQTSEDLEFDRDLAALQQAASTVGYDFELMMSPWHVTDLDQPKGLKDARGAEAYRKSFGDEPGALLFRRRLERGETEQQDLDALLMVILVPESPTYGLNMHAAREAMSALPALRDAGFHIGADEANEKTIRWIGPSFSASVSGLNRLKSFEYPDISFDVLSGSVTTDAANKLLAKINGNSGRPTSLSEPDAEALRLLLDQQIRQGLGPERSIAVLQEDESTYGGEHFSRGDDTSNERIRYFSFPRGISHVRGIYGKSLTNFNPAQVQTSQGTSSNTSSSFDFQDELQQPLDTVPEFATQSPSSNESVLAAIASSIKHMHSHALVILTSDPLDLLFLARYFRQECPDTQLVLFNAERLLTRLRGEFNLDGTLVVTRFPLFQNSYLQTPFHGQPRHSLTFTDSREESIFLAALMQIGSSHALPVQAPFSGRQFKMAPWIGVAAGGDFWPVAYLGESDELSGKIDTNKSLILTDTPPEPLPALWILALFGVLLCASVHFLFFLIAVPLNRRFRNSDRTWMRKTSGHRLLTFYLVAKAPDEIPLYITTGQCWWLLNITVQLILLLCYFLLPALLYEAKIQHVSSISEAISGFAVQTTLMVGATIFVLLLQIYLVSALLFLLGNHAWQLRANTRARIRCLLLPCLSFTWLAMVLILFCSQLVDAPTSFAFAARCLHLSSGACPILPLLLISLGFLLAAAVNLNALGMAANRNPGLPALFTDIANMECWHGKLTDYTELWYGLPAGDGYLLAVAILLGYLLLHPRQLFSTFDISSISWLYTLSFVMAIWTILWLWARFIRMWGVLRYGLDFLEGTTLRFAFSRLPAIFSVDPIWSYAGLRRVMVLPMRWLEYLKVAPQAATHEKPAVLLANEQDLKEILQQMGNSQWTSGLSYTDFSRRQNEYAVTLSQTDAIRNSWNHGGPDCDAGNAPMKKAESSGQESSSQKSASGTCLYSRIDLPLPCGAEFDSNNSFVEVGNEFIAMRVAAYIRYITLHMKNLMTFMSIGFLFALLAAISYPFNKPQVIAWLATLLLVALLFSIGTVLAQMDRDAILSRLGNTTPGQFHYGAFLKHMLAVGGLPLLTVLSTLFPAIGSFLFSWAGPVLENLH